MQYIGLVNHEGIDNVRVAVDGASYYFDRKQIEVIECTDGKRHAYFPPPHHRKV